MGAVGLQGLRPLVVAHCARCIPFREIGFAGQGVDSVVRGGRSPQELLDRRHGRLYLPHAQLRGREEPPGVGSLRCGENRLPKMALRLGKRADVLPKNLEAVALGRPEQAGDP